MAYSETFPQLIFSPGEKVGVLKTKCPVCGTALFVYDPMFAWCMSNRCKYSKSYPTGITQDRIMMTIRLTSFKEV